MGGEIDAKESNGCLVAAEAEGKGAESLAVVTAGVETVNVGGEMDAKESSGCLLAVGAEGADFGNTRAESLTVMTAGISTICPSKI